MMVRVLLVLCTSLAAVIALSTRYVNEDLFGGLAAGRDIASGLLVSPDHWSFTAESLIWVNQSWLSHLTFFLSYETLADAGPVLIKVVLFLACLGLVLYRSLSLGAALEISLVTLLAGILATAPFLALRQENFGLFFFIAFTTLLVSRDLSERARQIGLLVVVVVWSNFHGSFMLGLALLGVKAVLETVRNSVGASRGASSRAPWKTAAEWWLVCVAATLLTAYVNPFGTKSLLMPFQQVENAAVTKHSADWLPLLRFQQGDEGLFAGGNNRPYLVFVSILVVLLAVVLVKRYRGSSEPHALLVLTKSDWIMESLTALVTVVLAFRFGRLALFSGLSLIPPGAWLMQFLVRQLGSAGRTGGGVPAWARRLAPLAAGLLLVLMAVLCFRVAVVPYLPGNPVRPARPVMRELMSFDSFSRPLATFMKENQLMDRVLVGWALSPYLMWELPRLRLFMDTRDQSYYPSQIIRDYFEIMGVVPAPMSRVMALLDEYRVETVALTTGPVDFDLALRLLGTKRWACVYADPYAVLLVKADSPRFRTMIKTGDLGGLRFLDRAARTRTEATLNHFMYGAIPRQLAEALLDEARRSPWPNSYSLMCWGLDDPRGCFRPETVGLLGREADRLSKIDPHFADGAEQVTQSLVRIFQILAENAVRCRDPGRATLSVSLRDRYQREYEDLRRYYLGAVFSPKGY